MNEHKKFEILCALAVVGQVSDADLRELKQHIEGCVDCQNRISDFAQISAQALPLSAEKYSTPRSPTKMTARFVERARAEGIPLRDSEEIVPSDLSFASLSWKGNLAAALLLIAIIAGGISKVVHSRAQSADTAKSVKLELPTHRSIQTEIPQTRSTPQATKLLRVPRQMKMSNARYLKSVHTPRRPNSEQESGSLSPEQAPPDIQYSATQYQGKAAFDTQLFSSDVKNEYPGLFQAYDSGSGRKWLVAPSLLPFTQRNLLVNGADHVGTVAREDATTFAITSLNLPLHLFVFGSDRPLRKDSPRTQSELNLNIDWYQVQLKMRTESLQNSDDFSQYHPSVMAPAWPFSKEPKREER
jgi:hypothetical protein